MKKFLMKANEIMNGETFTNFFFSTMFPLQFAAILVFNCTVSAMLACIWPMVSAPETICTASTQLIQWLLPFFEYWLFGFEIEKLGGKRRYLKDNVALYVLSGASIAALLAGNMDTFHMIFPALLFAAQEILDSKWCIEGSPNTIIWLFQNQFSEIKLLSVTAAVSATVIILIAARHELLLEETTGKLLIPACIAYVYEKLHASSQKRKPQNS